MRPRVTRPDEPPVPPADCAPGAVLRETEGRTETAGRGPRGQRVVIVRTTAPAATAELEVEADLLEQLTSLQAEAFPRVLGRTPTAYVREDAAPPGAGRGRRRADLGSPRTAERLAQGAAREMLDGSLAVLHELGWTLGSEAADGLGIRDDGTVLIRDLAGLRRGEGLRERLVDQRWIDSVLGDAGRTLRRRAEAVAADPAAGDRADAVGAPDGRPAPRGESSAGHGRFPVARSASARREPGRSPEPTSGGGTGRRRIFDPTVPSGIRRRSAPRAGASRARALVRWYPVLLALVFVVSAVTVMSLGAQRGAVPTAGSEATRGAASPVASAEQESPAVSPPDPRTLVSDLATARREALAGGDPGRSTATGSTARLEDERLSRAYIGIEVQGWSTTVESAEVVAFEASDGTATIRARVAESERTLRYPDGTTRTVPATPPHDVELDLLWSEGRWVVAASRQAI